MRIKLSDAGKRFNREWIFRHADLEFFSGTAYAITGINGSGKSTLLQTIACLLMPSEGTVSFFLDDKPIPVEKAHQYISYSAPYLEVVEEMTLTEFLQFHQVFKPFIKGSTIENIVEKVGLVNAAQKQIRDFSSGMKQRVKLAQAIFSDTPILLLDEPCSNLDTAGIDLYQQLIKKYCLHRLVIVSSNDVMEYSFCKEVIGISNFK
jgi:ABC-type multidrug transport system ATPase subunit